MAKASFPRLVWVLLNCIVPASASLGVHDPSIFEFNQFFWQLQLLLLQHEKRVIVDVSAAPRSAGFRQRLRRFFLCLEESCFFFYLLLFVSCLWCTDALTATQAFPQHCLLRQRLTPDMTAGRPLWPHSGGQSLLVILLLTLSRSTSLSLCLSFSLSLSVCSVSQ